MLDREVVERLEKKLAVARGDTSPFGGPFQVDDARNEILARLPELMRVYRMWMEAPEGMIATYPNATDRATYLYFNGKGDVQPGEVRLVRDGEPGGG